MNNKINKQPQIGIEIEQNTKIFLKQMDNDKCRAKMLEYKREAMTKDVYLVCYENHPVECHRHIILDLINRMELV